jgi:anaerobic selenocysteine-containing dehydrogenase
VLHASTRRGFLARTLAGAAALAAGLPLRDTFAARKPLKVYMLDPRSGKTCGSCSSCRACRLHGANKLFASKEAADTHRAHPNCNCAIRVAGVLPTTVWIPLFGLTGRDEAVNGVVDRRHVHVGNLLKNYEADLA